MSDFSGVKSELLGNNGGKVIDFTIDDGVVAWISINDTNIDYPIMQGDDNNYYLSHDYNGEYSVAGSIFLDYRNSDLRDDYFIIYGHHMSNNRMFGGIDLYADANYLNTHKDGVLYTADRKYLFEVMALAKVDTSLRSIYDVRSVTGDNLAIARDYIVSGSLEKWGGERIMIMSTCNENGSSGRDILISRIIE